MEAPSLSRQLISRSLACIGAVRYHLRGASVITATASSWGQDPDPRCHHHTETFALAAEKKRTAGGSKRMSRPDGTSRFKPRVLAVVAAIPKGQVTTYGTIARHLGVTARQVAFVLATLTV